MVERLFKECQYFLGGTAFSQAINGLMSLTVVTILYSPRLAGHINITHNYHPQRKESINNLG